MPFINAIINDIKFVCLVDTGAELSLISYEFVESNLRHFRKQIVKNKLINLVTANNKRFTSANRSLFVTIEIGNKTIEDTILMIKGLNVNCIIGIDLIEKFGMIIKAPSRTIQIGNNSFGWMGDELVSEIGVISEEISTSVNYVIESRLGELEENVGNKMISNLSVGNDLVKPWRGQIIDCKNDYFDLLEDLLEINIELINENSSVARDYEHKLQIMQDKPFKCRTYPIPFAYKEQVSAEITKMIKDGIIKKASTSYLNPLVIVKKKDGSIRMCLDARNLNAISKPQYETPEGIDTLLARLGDKCIFSKLDLKNSFWLIKLHPDSQKYTGFSVNGATYVFRVVPFGLSSSSAALVNAMQGILDKFHEFCAHYVDDIIIFSKSANDHKKHLGLILNALNVAGLKLNLEKCAFFKDSVNYLGYIINKTEIKVDDKRLEDIKKYPRPSNLRTLRGFLGLMNYYRKFVPNYSILTIPLQVLLKKEEKWNWDKEKEDAFVKIKEAMFDNLKLIHPNFKKKFILKTDASDYAIAGALIQIHGDLEVPVCFVSRTLKNTELKYTTTEKEMLSIVYSIGKLKYYLMGNKFIIQTDHSALTFLMRTKFTNNRIYRWALLIQDYDFEIMHIKGKDNIIADALSRKDIQKNVNKGILIALNRLHTNETPFTEEQVIEAQRDEGFDELRAKLSNRDERAMKSFKIKERFIIKTIRGLELYLINEENTINICRKLHLKYGHIGIRKTWLIFRENYFCKKDLRIMKRTINKCTLCTLGKYKNFHNKNLTKSVEVKAPGDLVAIDYIGNLIPSGANYKNILVVVDAFTKYVKLYPTVACTTDISINQLEKYYHEIISPRTILADNATYFQNAKFKNYWNNKGVKVVYCSIRHPQGNMSERYVQETTKFLRLLVYQDQTSWYQYVPLVEKFINHTPNTVTEESPIYLMFGEQPERPWISDDHLKYEQRLIKARNKLQKKSESYLRKINEKIKKRCKFKINDWVIVKSLRVGKRSADQCLKLQLPFEGPFIVDDVNGDTYRLKYPISNKIRGKFHLDMLYKYEDNEIK